MAQSSLDVYQKLIDECQSVQKTEAICLIKRADDLIANTSPILQQRLMEQKRTASRFNIFNVMGLAGLEDYHSSFLGHLLDPRASHDQEDMFLRGFMETVIGCHPIPQDSINAIVMREQCVEPFGRLDITIYWPSGQILVIENKINAQEGEEQIARYLNWLNLQPEPRIGEHLLAFLTPTGRKPKTSTSEHVRCISYLGLGDWLSTASSSVPGRLQVILTQYIETCYNFSNDIRRLNMTDELTVLLRQPDKLEVALDIFKALEWLQKDIYKEYWRNVRDILQNQLGEGGNDEKWEVYMAEDVFDTYSKLGLVWRERAEGILLFSVLFECLAGKPTYYGIMRGKPIGAESLNEQDKILSGTLTKELNFSKSIWWAGYQNLSKVNLTHFNGVNKQNVLSLHKDNLNDDHPLARMTASVLWGLFLRCKIQLETLNEQYPY